MGVIGIGGTTIATSIVSITATEMTGMTAGAKQMCEGLLSTRRLGEACLATTVGVV